MVKEENKKEEAESKEEDIIEDLKEVETPEEIKGTDKIEETVVSVEGWDAKTELGRKIKDGSISKIDYVLDNGMKILEVEIVDSLMPNIQTDLLLIGQAKGKFGGGQRRVFKQTQKKTKEGNKPKFGTYAVVGNLDGVVGVGHGKSKETVPAREKAIRNAKLSIFKIRRGCGSWACGCKEPHSIPFEVKGKCGSCKMVLRPAPKGTGLVVEKECQKILKMAGIKDVFSKTFGQTKTKTNLINACIESLRELTKTKINSDEIKELGIVDKCIGVSREDMESSDTKEEKNHERRK